nr:MAG TPA: hypothetical protein [Caudoviricetes sp.]
MARKTSRRNRKMKVQRLIEKYKKLEGVWDAEGAELAR